MIRNMISPIPYKGLEYRPKMIDGKGWLLQDNPTKLSPYPKDDSPLLDSQGRPEFFLAANNTNHATI